MLVDKKVTNPIDDSDLFLEYDKSGVFADVFILSIPQPRELSTTTTVMRYYQFQSYAVVGIMINIISQLGQLEKGERALDLLGVGC